MRGAQGKRGGMSCVLKSALSESIASAMASAVQYSTPKEAGKGPHAALVGLKRRGRGSLSEPRDWRHFLFGKIDKHPRIPPRRGCHPACRASLPSALRVDGIKKPAPACFKSALCSPFLLES